MADPALLPRIAMAESGNRNIPGPMTDSGRAGGYYQITEGTWRDFAPKLGVDLGLYPDATDAPEWMQTQVAKTIPLKRWDPITLRKVQAELGTNSTPELTEALGLSNAYGITPPGHMGMEQFTPYIQRMRQNLSESERATAPFREGMINQLGADMARAHKAADAIEPVDIQKWTLPPPKNDPVDGFASIGAIFAGIASAFTHTPAINAMNGMASAIEARNQGNQEAYKQSYQAWKDNTELAIKRQEIQSKAFTRALDLMKTDVAAGSAALKAAASIYGDRNALTEVELGLYSKVAERNAVSDMMMEGWKFQLEKLETSPQRKADQDVENKAAAKVAELEKASGHPLTEAEKSDIRIQARADAKQIPISDEAADFTAGRVLAGDESATVGMARNSSNITKVTNSIVRLAKEQDISPEELSDRIAEFKGLIAGERTLATRAANMETAANIVRGMAPKVLAASLKVDRTQYPSINSAILAAKKGTGDPDVVRFGQAANALVYEYAKFLTPTGVPTDADKARATEILDTAWSQGQLEAAIDQIVTQELPAGAAGIAATRMEFRNGMWRRTLAAPGETGAEPSAPAGTQQARPTGATPNPDTISEGSVVTQDGVKYRKTNGQWVPVQ